MNTVTLNNGVEMPQTGYGVYQVSPAECERCVSDALSVGYRMIDTAQAYHNEEGVGNAVRKSGISRQEIFLVSKVWISNYGYEKAKASIDESLTAMTPTQEKVLLKRSIRSIAQKSYLITDASKFHSAALYCVDHLMDYDGVITDAVFTESERRLLGKRTRLITPEQNLPGK